MRGKRAELPLFDDTIDIPDIPPFNTIGVMKPTGVGEIKMATDLAKMYISRIISMTFYDRNTGKVLEHWDSEKCRDLNIEMEVGLTLSEKKEDWDMYDLVMENEYIYSLMYGCRNKNSDIEDDIVRINTAELKWSKDKTKFYFVWGWPGPDFNRYTREDYLKTWALSKKGLIEAWKDLEDKNENN